MSEPELASASTFLSVFLQVPAVHAEGQCIKENSHMKTISIAKQNFSKQDLDQVACRVQSSST